MARSALRHDEPTPDFPGFGLPPRSDLRRPRASSPRTISSVVASRSAQRPPPPSPSNDVAGDVLPIRFGHGFRYERELLLVARAAMGNTLELFPSSTPIAVPHALADAVCGAMRQRIQGLGLGSSWNVQHRTGEIFVGDADQSGEWWQR